MTPLIIVGFAGAPPGIPPEERLDAACKAFEARVEEYEANIGQGIGQPERINATVCKRAVWTVIGDEEDA